MITIEITISFISGLVAGGIGGYALNVYFSNRSQKSSGDKSPNMMGDSNSVKY